MNNQFDNILSACYLCPHNCGVDRYHERGFCQAGAKIKINLARLHHGEEPILSGSQGSGTIFFSHCNLQCVFCQNYTISSLGWGDEIEVSDLIEIMFKLQDNGAHNINLVTPTHYSSLIASALSEAKRQALKIPIVWNSNGYENVNTLRFLEGLVDVYLPDLKYAHGIYSKTYSHASDYVSIARKAITEMYRQVGNVILDDSGIIIKGLIIRLLVLPNRIAGINDSLHYIEESIGTDVYLSLMSQYYPTHRASEYSEINRAITYAEYQEVVETVHELGFNNVFLQDLNPSSEWTPDFKQEMSIGIG